MKAHHRVAALLLLSLTSPLHASIGGYQETDTFGDTPAAHWSEQPLDWRPESGSWKKATSPVTSKKALHLDTGSGENRVIAADLQGESLSGPITLGVRYSRNRPPSSDGNQSFNLRLVDSRGNGYVLRNRTYDSNFKYVLTKVEGTTSTEIGAYKGDRDEINHVYKLELMLENGKAKLVVVDENTGRTTTPINVADARLVAFDGYDRVKIEQRREDADFWFEEFSILRAPFRNLTLLGEVDVEALAPGATYEQGGVIDVKDVLGQKVRSAAPKQDGWFGFRIGDNTLVPTGKPYLLELVVPEDVPRGWLVQVMDTSRKDLPGAHLAFHTGIYNAESKSGFFDYNKLNQKLRQRFVSYWITVWPSQYDDFKKGERLWVYCFNKWDDELNQGVAVKAARLYRVNDVADIVDPEVDSLRTRSPRRMIWSTESQQYPIEADIIKTRVAGANTLAYNLMPWNFNVPHTPPRFYSGYQTYLNDFFAKAMPVAQAQGVNLVARLEYGHSPWVYAVESFEDSKDNGKLSQPDDVLQWKPQLENAVWSVVKSPASGAYAMQMTKSTETKTSYVRTQLPNDKRVAGPVTVRVDYSREGTVQDNAVVMFIRLLDPDNNGYLLSAHAAKSNWQYELVRVDAGVTRSLVMVPGEEDEQGGSVYRMTMTVGTNTRTLVLENLKSKTKKVLFDESGDTRMKYGANFKTLDVGQRLGNNQYYFEEVAVGRKGAIGVSTRGTEWQRESMQIGGHLGTSYTRANIIIDPAHPNERGSVILEDLVGFIDDVYTATGTYSNQLAGIYLRNRVGRLAPSFSDADIAQYERETNTKVAGETYDAKRLTLDGELKFPYGGAFSVGDAWKHPYMQWWYGKLGVFVQTVQDRVRAKWGPDKDVYFGFRSAEGFMNDKPTTPAGEWLNNVEWGMDSEFGDALTGARFFNVVTQPWQANNPAYLRGKEKLDPLAILVEPGYIEFSWKAVPLIKPAPSFEPGSKEYAARIELLATAYGDPVALSRETFASIQRGFPGDWADFARQFYTLPKSGSTFVDLGGGIVALTYPSGEIALFNVTESELTFSVSARWPTLKEVRNNRALDPAKIKLRAFSMVVVKR